MGVGDGGLDVPAHGGPARHVAPDAEDRARRRAQNSRDPGPESRDARRHEAPARRVRCRSRIPGAQGLGATNQEEGRER